MRPEMSYLAPVSLESHVWTIPVAVEIEMPLPSPMNSIATASSVHHNNKHPHLINFS